MDNQDESLLLYLNDAIATTRNKDTLFRIIAAKLRLVFSFNALAIIVLDAEQHYSRVFLRDYYGEPLPEQAANALAQHVREHVPVPGSPTGRLLREMKQQPRLHQYDLRELLAADDGQSPFHPIVAQGLHYATLVPLRTGGQLIGLLSLVARKQLELTPDKVSLLEKIGSLVAIAVTNTLAFEEISRREQQQATQLALTQALLRIKERGALFQAIVAEINRVLPLDYFGVRLPQADSPQQVLVEFIKQPNGTFQAFDENHRQALPSAEAAHLALNPLFTRAGVYVGASFQELAVAYTLIGYIHAQYTIQSLLCIPLPLDGGPPVTLVLASRQPLAFRQESLVLMQGLASQIQLAVQNVFAFEQMAALQAQLERERTYLLDEINTTASARFGDFVGGSTVMQRVFRQVEQVASLDTTVLITGETGTGKELVARALHNHSPRQARALVKVNCATLPAQLIESELFGHEKGAFTGAHDRRIGKFELAEGGTIFLDEIGELPLDLQAKLLRILQEKEFERLGGSRVLHANVRVLTATNRVLADEVAAGRFRADLYFRLDVFPIHLPALRERPEDVELLVRHFLQDFTRKFGKPVRRLRARDLEALQHYPWPGNIRELEHVVERAVIASTGPHLEFVGFAAAPVPTTHPLTNAPLATLHDHERAHIMAALAHTNGRISGPQGAAVLLDINPKTLATRMIKLGIRRSFQTD